VSLAYPNTWESGVIGFTPTGSHVATGGLTANAVSQRLMSQTMNLSLSGNVRYASALFRKNAANGGGVTNDNILLEFFDAAGNRRGGFGIEGNTDRPWLNHNASTTAATAVVPGETYFIITKIVSAVAPGLDMHFLKVYGPGYATQVTFAEPTTWDAMNTQNTAANLDRLRIRIDPGNTTALAGEVDEIRIGDTWASVAYAAAVPEVTPLALMSAVGIVFAAGRRVLRRG
jgi:hypothetical protein